MRFVILGLLLMRPATLYDLKRRFEQGVSLFYAASFGSIGSALKALEADGLVHSATSVVGGRNRREYAVTEAGERAFHAWMDAPLRGRNVDGLALAKVYLLGLVDSPARRAAVLGTLAASRVERRADLEALAEHLDATPVPDGYRLVLDYQRAVLEHGIRGYRDEASWLADLARSESGD